MKASYELFHRSDAPRDGALWYFGLNTKGYYRILNDLPSKENQ